MKKQELIHLHGLLAEVSNHYEVRNDEQINLEEYNSLGIRPTSIHKSKTDHKAAVFALIRGITRSMSSSESAEKVAAKAD